MQYIIAIIISLVVLVSIGYQVATEPEKNCAQVTTGTINGEPVRLCTQNR
jgi:hypothetical protein